MTNRLFELRKKPHTSISALRTFLTCPRRYSLQYVERVRPDFNAAALALGSAWHESVADWLSKPEADERVLDEELRERIQQRLRRDDVPVLFDDDDENEDEFIAKAVIMFRAFRASTQRPRKVLASELPFETSIVHPTTGEVLVVPVIGAIDAIVVDDEKQTTLWELKTAKKKWSTDQIEFDLQTTLYRKAARELGYHDIRLRVLVTTKAKEPHVRAIDIERNDADEDELAEVFFGAERAVRAGVDHPLRGWQCRSCSVASACRR